MTIFTFDFNLPEHRLGPMTLEVPAADAGATGEALFAADIVADVSE